MQEIQDLQNLEAQRQEEIKQLKKDMIDTKKELESQRIEFLSLQRKYEEEKLQVKEQKHVDDHVSGKKRSRDLKLFESFLDYNTIEDDVVDMTDDFDKKEKVQQVQEINVSTKGFVKNLFVTLFTGKYTSLYLRSINPDLTNPVRVNGNSIQVTQSWTGEIIRNTFDLRSMYIHNVTPLDIAHKQTLRGSIKKVESEFILEAKSSMNQTFQKSRFRFIFDTRGNFLRGFEYGLVKNEEIGWIE
jgi:hypothetical protein